MAAGVILIGDVRERLADLADGSVHCVITSPPYWGLRDYGTSAWVGGNRECDHPGGAITTEGITCGRCGARRVDHQLGLEPTIDEYIANMVGVFREVRRVLRDDGTLWLNLGDSYSANWSSKRATGGAGFKDNGRERTTRTEGFAPKQLLGQPWRLAFALQADGWWLRSDIIWAKPNPMPESVTDRPTKSHEHLFLLAKQPRYYYDADAIREAASENTHSRGNGVNPKATEGVQGQHKQNASFSGAVNEVVSNRNKRDVWSIPTQPYPDAHFATFPEALVRPCVLAGTSEKGVCAECGAPWVRVVDVTREWSAVQHDGRKRYEPPGRGADGRDLGRASLTTQTTGWQPTCEHAGEPIPATVCDPFGGSGTVGKVAHDEGRHYVLVELNPEYAAMAERRIQPMQYGLAL